MANFERFCASMRRQADLYVIELAYGPSAPFVIPDAWIKLRTDSVLWHKENLLNILAKALPEKYSAVAWVDSDVLFSDDGWPAKAESLLELSGMVQLCSSVLHAGQHSATVFLTQPAMAKVYHDTGGLPNPGMKGHPGMGWAVRRDFFDVGLFDKMVVGGGDEMAFYSSIGLLPWFLQTRANPVMFQAMVDHLKKANVYFNGMLPPAYVDQAATHLWHGYIKDRSYLKRQLILAQVEPRHLSYRSDGLLEWSSEASFQLRRDIGSYFRSRREDANDDDHKPAPRPV
jgi:hypothetical protein